jgi:tetratricopeptide (TPR) repeat protein
MSVGDIAIMILKVVAVAVPVTITVLILAYLDRPVDLRTLKGRKYAIKYWLVLLASSSVSFIIFLAILGAIKPRLVLLLSPVLVGAVILVIYQLSIGRLLGFDVEVGSNATPNRWTDGRREYSRYYIDLYLKEEANHPDHRHTLKQLALMAVKKDKNNPRAQYLLARSYMELNNTKKAKKHILKALAVDPSRNEFGELYSAIVDQAERIND